MQAVGIPPIQALVEGSSQAVDNLMAGKTGFGMVADNVAQRTSAGVFFLNIVTRQFELQHGGLTWASILWMVPSVFIDKPPLQAEQMIQLLAHQALIDDANSVQLIFYADWGPLGLFLAGIYSALLLYVLAKLLARSGQFSLFQIVVLGTFFTLAMAIEMELGGHFVAIRNALILLPVSLLLNGVASQWRGQTRAHSLQRRRPPQVRSAANFPARLAAPGSLAPQRAALREPYLH